MIFDDDSLRAAAEQITPLVIIIACLVAVALGTAIAVLTA